MSYRSLTKSSQRSPKKGNMKESEKPLPLQVPWQTKRAHVGAFYTTDGVRFDYESAISMMPTSMMPYGLDQDGYDLSYAKAIVEAHLIEPTRRIIEKYSNTFLGVTWRPDALTFEKTVKRLHKNVLPNQVNPNLRKLGFLVQAVTFAQRFGRHGNVLVLRLVRLRPRQQNQQQTLCPAYLSNSTQSFSFDGNSSWYSPNASFSSLGSAVQSRSGSRQRCSRDIDSELAYPTPTRKGSFRKKVQKDDHTSTTSSSSLSLSPVFPQSSPVRSPPPRLSPSAGDTWLRQPKENSKSGRPPATNSESRSSLLTPRRFASKTASATDSTNPAPQLPVAPLVSGPKKESSSRRLGASLSKKGNNKNSTPASKVPVPAVQNGLEDDDISLATFANDTIQSSRDAKSARDQVRYHYSWNTGLDYFHTNEPDDDAADGNPRVRMSKHSRTEQGEPLNMSSSFSASYSSVGLTSLLDDLVNEINQQDTPSDSEDATDSETCKLPNSDKSRSLDVEPEKSSTLDNSDKSLSLETVCKSPVATSGQTKKKTKKKKNADTKQSPLSALEKNKKTKDTTTKQSSQSSLGEKNTHQSSKKAKTKQSSLASLEKNSKASKSPRKSKTKHSSLSSLDEKNKSPNLSTKPKTKHLPLSSLLEGKESGRQKKTKTKFASVSCSGEIDQSDSPKKSKTKYSSLSSLFENKDLDSPKRSKTKYSSVSCSGDINRNHGSLGYRTSIEGSGRVHKTPVH